MSTCLVQGPGHCRPEGRDQRPLLLQQESSLSSHQPRLEFSLSSPQPRLEFSLSSHQPRLELSLSSHQPRL